MSLTKNDYAAIAEIVRLEIKTQLYPVNKSMDSMYHKLNRFSNELDNVNKRLDNVDKRLDNVDKQLKILNTRVSNIEDSLGEVRTSTNTLLDWANRVEPVVDIAL